MEIRNERTLLADTMNKVLNASLILVIFNGNLSLLSILLVLTRAEQCQFAVAYLKLPVTN